MFTRIDRVVLPLLQPVHIRMENIDRRKMFETQSDIKRVGSTAR